MEKMLISACLIGDKTRYDGKGCYNPDVELLKEKYDLVPFCPEVEGGLKTPRLRSEKRGDFDVFNEKGHKVTFQFRNGAERALSICKYLKIKYAVLKDESPSCATSVIYDGSFTNKKIKGEGFTTSLLRRNGITCISEKNIIEFLEAKKIALESSDIEKDRVTLKDGNPVDYSKSGEKS